MAGGPPVKKSVDPVSLSWLAKHVTAATDDTRVQPGPSLGDRYLQAVRDRFQQFRKDPLAPLKDMAAPVVQQAKDIGTIAGAPNGAMMGLLTDPKVRVAAARTALNLMGAAGDPFAGAAESAIPGAADRFAIITGENPGGLPGTAADNAVSNRALESVLKQRGYRYARTTGRYTDNTTGKLLEENGFLVHDIHDEDARALGKQFGQNGVVTSSGYHDLANGQVFPSRGIGPTTGVPHTQLPNGQRFALDIDFDHPLPKNSVPDAARVAQQFRTGKPQLSRVAAVDPEKGRAMAQAFEKLPTNDPNAKGAYDALNRDVAGQLKAIQDAGYKIEYVDHDPYKTSKEMMDDVRNNRTLKVLKTNAESAHPYMTPEQNDAFRAVHDFIAHAGGGNSFSALGEENAFREHAGTLSPEALPALASETRGQNSFVNFGPNSHLPPAERPFAPQKAALFPTNFLGEYGDMPAATPTDEDVLRGRLASVGQQPFDQLSDRDWLHTKLLQHGLDDIASQRIANAPPAAPAPLPPPPGAGWYDVQTPAGVRAIQADSPQHALAQAPGGRILRYQPGEWQPDPRGGLPTPVNSPARGSAFQGPGQEYLANRANGFGRPGSTGVNMMGTIAGAGTGAAAGGTQGSTPEERIRNAALGAVGGGVLGFAAPEMVSRALGESAPSTVGPLYHGTVADFDQFAEPAPPNPQTGFPGALGIHFGTPEQAEYFAQPGGRILRRRLQLSNPLRVRDAGMWEPEDVRDKLEDTGLFSRDELEAAKDIPALRQLIQSKGYDGLVYQNRFESPSLGQPDDSYAVFSPNQILDDAGRLRARAGAIGDQPPQENLARIPARRTSLEKQQEAYERVRAALQSPEGQRVRGLGFGVPAAQGWYDPSQLLGRITDAVGDDQARPVLRNFADFMGTTTARSTPWQNVKRALALRSLTQNGLISPEALRAGDVPLPPGLGHFAANTHNLATANMLERGYIDPFSSPKGASFAENIFGNGQPATIDTILAQHLQRLDPGLSFAFSTDTPKGTFYRALERAYQDEALQARQQGLLDQVPEGVSPTSALQSVDWHGARLATGGMGGGNNAGTLGDVVGRQLDQTASQLGIPSTVFNRLLWSGALPSLTTPQSLFSLYR